MSPLDDALGLKAKLRSPELRPLRIWLLYRDRKNLERGAYDAVAAAVTRRLRLSLVIAYLAGVGLFLMAIADREGWGGLRFLIYGAIPIAVGTAEYLRVRRALRALLDARGG